MAVQQWDEEPVTQRLDEATLPRSVDASELAREVAVFCDRSVRKVKLPPDFRRQPFLHLRYRRLAALVSAFELGEIRDVIEGRFIKSRPIEAYAPVLASIRKHMPLELAEMPVGHSQIEFLYDDLLQFRADATLNACAEGALECGYVYGGYASWLSGEVIRPLQAQLARVDHVLAQILDPAGLSFDQAELVARFNFPDVDLSTLY